MSVRRTLARNTAWNAAGRLWEALAGLILIRYIIERVGLPLYGVWALLAAFTGYVALLDFGIGSAYVKYIAEHAARKEYDRVSSVVSAGFVFYFIFGIVLVAVGWPCAPYVVEAGRRFGLFEETHLADAQFLLRWGLVLFAATNCMAAFTAVQTGLQRMAVTNVLSFAASLVKIAATVLFLELGYGIRGVLGANALAFAAFSAGSVVVAFRLAPGLRVSPFALRRDTFGRLVAFGLRAQVAKLSNLVMFETDKVVAGLVFRRLNLIALYELGVNLANKMRQVPALLFSALVPAASDLDARDEQERLRRLYVVSTKYAASVAVPSALFTVAAAGPLIRTWLGPGHETSAWVLRVIAFGYIANILPGAGVSIALGKGRADLQMKAGLISMGSNIALTVALVWAIGFIGIPIATALSMVVSWTWFILAMRRLVNVGPRELLRASVWWPGLASLPGFLACVAVDVATTHVPGFLANAAFTGACVLVFGVSFMVLIRLTPFLDRFDVAFLEDTLGLGRVPGFRLWARRWHRV